MSSILMFWHDCCVCMNTRMYVRTYYNLQKKNFLDTNVCSFSFSFVNQALYTMLHVVSYTLAMSRCATMLFVVCHVSWLCLHEVLLSFLYVLMIYMFSTCYIYIYSHLVLCIVLCSVSLVFIFCELRSFIR